jgi:hypothetical protein
MTATMDARRRDPEALLARVKAEEARRHRGKLKVFFGAAPGVGKTYAMLEAAREQKAAGVDVIVGAVETHGRAETEALLDGLEILPRRDVEYRGTVRPRSSSSTSWRTPTRRAAVIPSGGETCWSSWTPTSTSIPP